MAPDFRRAIGSETVDAKIVDLARRAVDVRLTRYGWRSFHTLAGESSSQKRYVFRPPPALRYACIIGTDDEHART